MLDPCCRDWPAFDFAPAGWLGIALLVADILIDMLEAVVAWTPATFFAGWFIWLVFDVVSQAIGG